MSFLLTAEVLNTDDLTVKLTTHTASSSYYTWSHIFIYITAALLLYGIYQQVTYTIVKGSLPGPRLSLPLVGNMVQMIFHPYEFWHNSFALGHISVNKILNKCVFVLTKTSDVRQIFEQVSSEMPLVLHPNAHVLLGSDNIAFINGETHKNARMRLLPLFTQKALNVYLHIQQQTIEAKLKSWFDMSESGEPLVMQNMIYDLNTETSMKVFIGPYLADKIFVKFQHCYRQLTLGFLSFPLYFPGTQLYESRQCRLYIVSELEKYAAQAKQNARTAGYEPKCLLDFWMEKTVVEMDTWKAAGKAGTPPHSTDHEIANLMLDFLFASQDASTSSLTFAVHLLCEYPDVLQKIRAEQATFRQPFDDITGDTLPSLRYTWQTMREILRYRPPATMVPHVAKKDVLLKDSNTTIPSGSLIFPSVWMSNREGFADPETFDPERFSSERGEDKKYERNFLTFGTGPHGCLGQRYAMNHIVAFLSILATQTEFHRKQTPTMHKIKYFPTIYPDDGCVLEYIRPNKNVQV